jgi:photosystem II stability/assembly factor-like uncharacterized protein
MRKILLTMIAAVATFAAQSQWTNQNVPVPYDGYMFDIETIDANTVWGALWNGTAVTPYTADFVRTIDGGTTWTQGTVSSTAGLVISNIWPIDANTCYVAMCDVNVGGGAIYKTTDGGLSWAPASSASMFTQATSFCNVVYFADALNGFTMGDPTGAGANKRYELWTTQDGAATWSQVPVANIPALTNTNEYGITNLFSAIGDNIWFATTYGDVYRSTDKGLTWAKSASGFPAYTANGNRQDITGIAFSDATHGMIVQVNATSFITKVTADGGATWTTITPTGGTFYPTEISGIPNTSILVSGGSNATYGFGSSYSLDNGATWNDLDANASHTSFDFTDALTGFGGEYVASGNPGGAWKFTGSLNGLPINNECAGAIDVSNQLGQAVGVVASSGPYDNTLATSEPSDPTTGFSCFGEGTPGNPTPSLEQTLWFTFVGDGNNYFIEAPNTCSGVTDPFDFGDTQIAIYTGSCGNLVPAACNEDGPNTSAPNDYYPAGLNFQTVAGTVYYMLVDGYLDGGTPSNGQFCVQFTNLSVINCGDASVSSGLTTLNNPVICYDSTMVITTTGIVAPTVGTTHGFSLMVSTADISNNPDPLSTLTVVGGTGTIATGPNPSIISLTNTTATNPFGPGVFYITPVVYGNATGTGNITALTLDPACTYTGTSVMVTFLAQGTPCPTGINELNGNDFAISGVYPVPVKNNLNFILEVGKPSSVELSIKDILGRVVYTQTVQTVNGENKINIDMQKYNAGVYTISVANGNSIATSKFVKQ